MLYLQVSGIFFQGTMLLLAFVSEMQCLTPIDILLKERASAIHKGGPCIPGSELHQNLQRTVSTSRAKIGYQRRGGKGNHF